MTNISEKHLERVYYARVVCLMYKLKTSIRDSIDLSIAFDESNRRPQEKLTDNKKASNKGIFYLRINLKVVFGCAELQSIDTFSLG